MSLSHQDVRNILNILDHAEHLESIDLKMGEFRLQARKPGASWHTSDEAARPTSPPATQQPGLANTARQAVPAAPAAATPVAQPEQEVPAGMVAVRAPMLGTFFTRPSPDQPPFVGIGDAVQADDTVCLVEVMKMFNSVKAGVSGTVRQILVDSGQPVRHGQVLLVIEPAVQA